MSTEQIVVEREGPLGTTLHVHADIEHLPESLERIQARASTGDAGAQFLLGELYEIGHLVQKNNIEAYIWYFKAANQGHVAAQRELAVMLFRGQVGQRDYQQAFHWLKRAAESGDPRSQAYLGGMYFHGDGTPHDIIECEKWFRKSAEGGFALGRFELACLLKDGNDKIAEDKAQARAWLSLPAQQGMDGANPALADLDETLLRLRTAPELWDLRHASNKNNCANVKALVATGMRLGLAKGEGPTEKSPFWAPIICALNVKCDGESQLGENLRIIELLYTEMQRQSVQLGRFDDLLAGALENRKYAAAEYLLNSGCKWRDGFLLRTIHSDEFSDSDKQEHVAFFLAHGGHFIEVAGKISADWETWILEKGDANECDVERFMRDSNLLQALLKAAAHGNGLGFKMTCEKVERAFSRVPERERHVLKQKLLISSFLQAFDGRGLEVLDICYRLGDFSIPNNPASARRLEWCGPPTNGAALTQIACKLLA